MSHDKINFSHDKINLSHDKNTVDLPGLVFQLVARHHLNACDKVRLSVKIMFSIF